MFCDTIENQILDYLKENGMSVAWLTRQSGYSDSYFRDALNGYGKKKKKLLPRHVEKINGILGTDFKFPEPDNDAIDVS